MNVCLKARASQDESPDADTGNGPGNLPHCPLHSIFRAITLTGLTCLQGRASMPGVEDKVKQIIVDQLGVDAGDVTATSSFVDDLGADSLDRVELIMALEETFGIEIPDEDAEKIVTVQNAVDYIQKNAKSVKQ